MGNAMTFVDYFKQNSNGVTGSVNALRSGNTPPLAPGSPVMQPFAQSQQAQEQPAAATQQTPQAPGFAEAVKSAQQEVGKPAPAAQPATQQTPQAPGFAEAVKAAQQEVGQQAQQAPAEGAQAVEQGTQLPDKSEFNYFQDMMSGFEEPLTPEEQEKRKKAAHAIAGVGNLGNILSAFSNLAFAGAAPSQKLPDVPEAGKAVDAERSRWDKVRQDYVNAKVQGRKLDMGEYQQAVQNKQNEDKLAIQRKELERKYRNTESMIAKRDYEKQYREKKLSLDEVRLDLQRRKLDLDEAYRMGMLSETQHRNAINNWKAGIDWYNAQVRAGGSTRKVKKLDPITGQEVEEEVTVKPAGNIPPAPQGTQGGNGGGSAASKVSIHNNQEKGGNVKNFSIHTKN